MRQVNKVITYDNVVHADEKEARKYLDKIYGDTLLKVAREICEIQEKRYINTAEYIDKNLDIFALLNKIKKDYTYENNVTL